MSYYVKLITTTNYVLYLSCSEDYGMYLDSSHHSLYKMKDFKTTILTLLKYRQEYRELTNHYLPVYEYIIVDENERETTINVIFRNILRLTRGEILIWPITNVLYEKANNFNYIVKADNLETSINLLTSDYIKLSKKVILLSDHEDIATLKLCSEDTRLIKLEIDTNDDFV